MMVIGTERYEAARPGRCAMEHCTSRPVEAPATDVRLQGFTSGKVHEKPAHQINLLDSNAENLPRVVLGTGSCVAAALGKRGVPARHEKLTAVGCDNRSALVNRCPPW